MSTLHMLFFLWKWRRAWNHTVLRWMSLLMGPQMADKTNLGTKHVIVMWIDLCLFLVGWEMEQLSLRFFCFRIAMLVLSYFYTDTSAWIFNTTPSWSVEGYIFINVWVGASAFSWKRLQGNLWNASSDLQWNVYLWSALRKRLSSGVVHSSCGN